MQKGLKKYFVNMDEYLCSLGLYRKMVARDASSLFRAVSEQLYYSQNYHQRIRQDCADFMRANRCNFEPFVEGSFEKYLERLEDPKETVGHVEIKALSQLYRRCFLIYRYPGKPATVISEDDFVDKVTLCCSINGHYDIVYPRSYPASAALCQSLLYELIYTQVFGVEEAELSQAMEAFRVGGRRYRNSPSVCSDIDIGYDTPEDRGHREELEAGGAAEEKLRAVTDESKPPAEAPPPSRLSLPYKVMKSLDWEVYRNLEFDVWQDTCKEMQKTDYMVFAGRQYFLGDKCQVRLEPKGKYYNAFIQEVGTHSSAVTVFIEELGEKHLVPLTDLKPVNPVPAWNVAAPTRKGDLDLDSRGQRHHRHRYFRKSRGSSGVKGAELLMPPPSSYGGPAPSGLPPRFQPAGHPRPPPPPSPGAMTYDPYAPQHHHHHHHHPTARPPRYGASRSSTRFLNRHLIGPQLTYYHPGRRYYHDYENYAFRSRRSRRQLNKECQFGFSAEAVEEPTDLDPTMAYYQLDDAGDAVFPPLPGQAVAPPPTMGAPPPQSSSSYRVQRGSGPLPPTPPPGNTPVCSSEEDQEDRSTVEDQAEYTEEYIYITQDQSYQTSGVYTAAEPSTNQDEQEGGTADSPPRPEMNYSYTQQVVKPLAVVCSSPSSSSSSPSSPSSRVPAAAHLPPATQTRSVAMAIPAASPWLVNELGEALCTVVAPPPYSYDPNGSDLPRDCRVLQYYFNLGVQWYHQSCWQQQQVYPATSPEAPYPYQHYTPYLSQEPPMHAGPPLYPETARGPHQPPSSYPESSRAGDGQTDGHSNSPAPSMDSSSFNSAPPGSAPSSALLYQDQTAPPPLLHLPYEAPPPAAYLPSAPPPLPLPAHPHPAHLPHHSSYHPCLPPSTHWGALQTGGHAQRVYCPAPSTTHVVGYITAPPPHHTAAHYIPPTI
ncbi:putative bifunctional UDP-N-acetylglucosamine transferase and deubiquitinase ALG13 isoform X1 [Dicentrarchus labrax]|uniref:ubiquitinyl hydrolase 1 n=1 Tax=Dicentrarchus labrax TaxID=13489 RepID=A0A8P4JZ72_DICLA|nr:putative bifunctional UDP-N-acetylglucosamine transferase and deubiquitinase ALG13 isoform X1 [Dicentrarchus labrax]XP_051238629.1 putative bifunctional UDP-N-acetylglucosamine transferase and deubiquitinase ALG13 isoform X1 [Dicentrarchus labrax]XP_051238631.1 putative bifunctional UDP-N-acetylglucosamine transferase and deubiquitinase ALG13 isoform X1 [Dicentrarchus labrax]